MITVSSQEERSREEKKNWGVRGQEAAENGASAGGGGIWGKVAPRRVALLHFPIDGTRQGSGLTSSPVVDESRPCDAINHHS